MDFLKMADEFIEEGGWQGSPRIAVELFAKWLEERAAAQQRLQLTVGGSAAKIDLSFLESLLANEQDSTPPTSN